MEKLTKEQAYKYKKELDYFYQQRTKLLSLGLILLSAGVILLIIAFAIMPRNSDFIIGMLLSYLAIFLVIGGIVVLILRSALYNARINNRKIALECYEENLKEEKEE